MECWKIGRMVKDYEPFFQSSIFPDYDIQYLSLVVMIIDF